MITSGNDIVSLNGNKVSLLKSGTAIITAIKSGDNKYNSTSSSITIYVGS